MKSDDFWAFQRQPSDGNLFEMDFSSLSLFHLFLINSLIKEDSTRITMSNIKCFKSLIKAHLDNAEMSTKRTKNPSKTKSAYGNNVEGFHGDTSETFFFT